MRVGALAVLLVVLIPACSDDAAETVVQEPPDKFRDYTSLECDTDRTSASVLDYDANASGLPTPEEAAQEEITQAQVEREGWTRRTTTDATGAVFIDYLTQDGRLVLYVKPQQQPDGTWLAGQVAACEA